MGFFDRFRESAAAPKVSAGLSTGDLAEILLTTVPELSEAYTRADIELALDDRGWIGYRSSNVQPDLEPQSRMNIMGRSRLYWLRDPLAKQAVRLWTDYSMGTGITFTSSDPKIQQTIGNFMNDRRNRRVLNSEGQRKSSKKLLVDGEIFFAIFKDADGKVIRWIDPIQITDIVADPEDSEHILGYRRVIPSVNGSPEKSIFYADWTANQEDRTLGEQQKIQNNQVKFEADVVVYHIAFDTLHQRGNGLLSTAVDWSREHRRFMEARVAITQSLSKYAHKLVVKGGQTVVDKIKNKLQSTYAGASANTIEKNPSTAPGGTWIQNDGLDLTAVPRVTGAGDAATDGNQLKLMVSAATGIMLHYFGDPSTGNLATATAMELPMLKQFESYQELWKDAYTDIFNIVLDENDGDGVPEDTAAGGDDEDKMVVDLPPILADDLTALGSAFNSFATLWPEIVDEDEVLTMVLTAMRVNNIDDVLANLRKLRKDAKQAQDDKAMALAKAQGATHDASGNPTGFKPVIAAPTKEAATVEAVLQASQTAAIDRLASALEEGTTSTLPAIAADSAPINLVVNIENKGAGTRTGTAYRDDQGHIQFEMQEYDDGEARDEQGRWTAGETANTKPAHLKAAAAHEKISQQLRKSQPNNSYSHALAASAHEQAAKGPIGGHTQHSQSAWARQASKYANSGHAGKGPGGK